MAAQPAWAGLLRAGIAKHKSDPTAKYCQLATAAVGGGASCRTWVFRGFWEDTGALKFITDRRSRKIPEITADPAGEVCFYLTKTREQFRIKGTLQVVAAGESDERLAKARKHQWTQISPSSQASFATALIPGLEALPVDDARDSAGGEGEHVREVEPPSDPAEEFCLILLWPNLVDHLVLRDGQTRHVHTLVVDRDVGEARSAVSPVSDVVSGGGGDEQQQKVGKEPSPEWSTVAVNP